LSWEWKDRPKKEGEVLDIPMRKEFDQLSNRLDVLTARAFNIDSQVAALKALLLEVEHELSDRLDALEQQKK